MNQAPYEIKIKFKTLQDKKIMNNLHINSINAPELNDVHSKLQ